MNSGAESCKGEKIPNVGVGDREPFFKHCENNGCVQEESQAKQL